MHKSVYMKGKALALTIAFNPKSFPISCTVRTLYSSLIKDIS